MKFPTGYPDFNDADKRELRSLGVTDEQIKHLRISLATVRFFADPNSYAPSKDIAEILSEIEKLSGALSKKLISLTSRRGAAQGAAYAMIEVGYWSNPEHAGNTGPDVNRIVSDLQALGAATRSAMADRSKRKGRTATADPRPIKRINDALLHGWTETKGSRVRTTQGNETSAGMAADARVNPPQSPYPDVFHPSKAVNSGFRKIVGICYATVGGNADPIRAIENYLSHERKSRRENMAAIEKGIAEANRKAKRMPATKRA